MRRKLPFPLLLPPVTLGVMLVVVLIMTACVADEEPEVTAPGPPPGEEFGDVPTGIAGGNELTPPVDPCDEAVPAPAVEVGVRQTVIGDVVNVREVEDVDETLTLLEFGEEGGEVPFAIAIPERVLPEFAAPPEELYAGREVCISGVVTDFEGVPTIFVSTDAEIVTTGN